jgi:hypothetical protein
MRGRTERSGTYATIPLTALAALLLASAASAGDGVTQGRDAGLGVAQCGEGGPTCTRIRGYIAAGGDRTSARPAPFGPQLPPLFAGFGAAGQAAANAINQGLFLLPASRGDVIR